jgi:preprotein translocase subunit Sec63
MSHSNKNPYNILNIPLTSSIDEVKKAYKIIALKSHPDKLNSITDITEKNKKIKEFIDATNAYNSIINNDYLNLNDLNYNFDNYENDYDEWIKTFNDIKNSNIFKGIINKYKILSRELSYNLCT